MVGTRSDMYNCLELLVHVYDPYNMELDDPPKGMTRFENLLPKGYG